jgi:hypothetical protein
MKITKELKLAIAAAATKIVARAPVLATGGEHYAFHQIEQMIQEELQKVPDVAQR